MTALPANTQIWIAAARPSLRQERVQFESVKQILDLLHVQARLEHSSSEISREVYLALDPRGCSGGGVSIVQSAATCTARVR